jgi:hypothetical protein
MDPTENTEGGSTENTEETLPIPEAPTPEVTADDPTDVTAENPITDDEEEIDPVEAAIQARLEQEADKMAEAAFERARRESEKRAEADRQRRLEAEEAEKLNNSFSTAIREAYDASKAKVRYTDEDGTERTIDDATFEEVFVKPMQKFNSTAEKAYQLRIYGTLAQSAMESLPAEVREKFAEQAAGKPLAEWLKTYAELQAPHTSFAKTVSKDTETKVKAAEARAFVKGQKAPAGTPKADGARSVQTNQPDLTTAFGIADARAKGLVDDDTARKAWSRLNS